MTPRWPLLVLFVAAGGVLAFPAIAAPFVDLSPATARFVHGAGVSLNFLIFGLAVVDLVISPSLRRIDVQRETSAVQRRRAAPCQGSMLRQGDGGKPEL